MEINFRTFLASEFEERE